MRLGLGQNKVIQNTYVKFQNTLGIFEKETSFRSAVSSFAEDLELTHSNPFSIPVVTGVSVRKREVVGTPRFPHFTMKQQIISDVSSSCGKKSADGWRFFEKDQGQSVSKQIDFLRSSLFQ